MQANGREARMRLKPESEVYPKAFQPIVVLFWFWSMILAGVRDGSPILGGLSIRSRYRTLIRSPSSTHNV
jgi:hypothetical protein